MRLKLLKTDEGTQSSRGNHNNKEIFTEIFSFYGLKWKIRFSGPHRVRDALVPSIWNGERSQILIPLIPQRQ